MVQVSLDILPEVESLGHKAVQFLIFILAFLLSKLLCNQYFLHFDQGNLFELLITSYEVIKR